MKYKERNRERAVLRDIRFSLFALRETGRVRERCVSIVSRKEFRKWEPQAGEHVLHRSPIESFEDSISRRRALRATSIRPSDTPRESPLPRPLPLPCLPGVRAWTAHMQQVKKSRKAASVAGFVRSNLFLGEIKEAAKFRARRNWSSLGQDFSR